MFVSLLVSMCVGCTKPANEPIEVMTFNVRYDNPDDAPNNWAQRKEAAAKMINYYAPDVFGAQEVLHHQLTDLKKLLPNYEALGVGRLDGKEAGEYAPVFYNKHRFEMVKYGNFALSEHPTHFGEKGWDAACERMATWVILKDIQTSKTFFFINTHLDHVGLVAQRMGAKLIQKKAVELGKGLPIIVTGDFNVTAESDAFLAMTEDGLLKDSRAIAPICYGPNWSFHAFGTVSLEERPLIDHIFVSKEFKIFSSRVIDDRAKNGAGYLSDHNPVMVKLLIR